MKAIFPGSFNPIHNAHIEIIKQAANDYEKLYVFVANNETKEYNRTLTFRKRLIEKALHKYNFKNVEVISQQPGTLTPDIAKELGVEAVIRGIRTKIVPKDEEDLAESYLDKNPNLLFNYIITKGMEVSSTMVNERLSKLYSINDLVPFEIEKDILTNKIENEPKKGKLVILCGPSGAGKGTIESKFLKLKEFDFHFSISATTRQIRKDEKDGIDYNFLSVQEFNDWIKQYKFLEYASFADNYYGTPIAPVQEMIDNGKNVFLEIELQGVRQVIKRIPEAITIFLSPPSIEELERRLRDRDSESELMIQKRVKTAKHELIFSNDKSLFKYNVVNNNVEEASGEIISILRNELL